MGRNYVRGTPEERFWAKVDRSAGDDACWPWLGAPMGAGYGQLYIEPGVVEYAHRFSFTLHHGPVPDGCEVDHACHNADTSCLGGAACPHRLCCNPRHLRAVDHAANVEAGRAGRQPTCAKGHPLTPENTYDRPDGGGRQCRACNRDRDRARQRPYDPAKRRAAYERRKARARA